MFPGRSEILSINAKLIHFPADGFHRPNNSSHKLFPPKNQPRMKPINRVLPALYVKHGRMVQRRYTLSPTPLPQRARGMPAGMHPLPSEGESRVGVVSQCIAIRKAATFSATGRAPPKTEL